MSHLIYILGMTINVACRLAIAILLYVTSRNFKLMYDYNETYLLLFDFGMLVLLFLGIGCGTSIANISETVYWKPDNSY